MRAYKLAQARFELTDLAHDRVTVGSQIRWQDFTQVNYFGIGADSLVAEERVPAQGHGRPWVRRDSGE